MLISWFRSFKWDPVLANSNFTSLHKNYWNRVTLTEQNLYSKSCLSSKLKLFMLRRLKSFKRNTVGLCRSTGCKVISCQSWQFKKILPRSPSRLRVARGRLRGRIFFKAPTLTGCNFAANWPTETHSTSLERSQPP